MSIGAGIGLAALIAAVIGAFVPILGLYIGWLALVLAVLAALFGDRGLTIATVCLSAIIFVFLTPTLWLENAAHATGYGQASGQAPVLQIASMALLAAPIPAIFLNGSGKLAFRRQRDPVRY